MDWSVGGERAARCLREKRARKRAARGEDSEVTMLRRARTVGSVGTGVAKMHIFVL
jgi:hypothetical protein